MCAEICHTHHYLWITAINIYNSLIDMGGFTRIPLCVGNIGKNDDSDSIVGSNSKDAIRFSLGFVETVRTKQDKRGVCAIANYQRIEFLCTLSFNYSILRLADKGQEYPITVVNRCQVWIELERTLEFR